MPRTSDFYSVNEAYRPVDERVYHNNSSCPSGCCIKEADATGPVPTATTSAGTATRETAQDGNPWQGVTAREIKKAA